MVIDSHAHVTLPAESQIKLMDEAGVDVTVLFATTPHPEAARGVPELEGELSKLDRVLSGKMTLEERMLNIHKIIDELAASIGRYPKRFIGFAPVPLGMTLEKTCRWVEAEALGRGMKGLGEFTLPPGGAALLEPVFQASRELGRLPIWIHTFHPLMLRDILDILGLACRYPEVPVILGHMGGVHWLDALKGALARPNVYLDLSAAFSTLAAGFAARELPGRTLFASDAPYGDPLLARQMVERVSPNAEAQRRILGENIGELLGI